jgi:C-terminal processing protease CtpA/Prc
MRKLLISLLLGSIFLAACGGAAEPVVIQVTATSQPAAATEGLAAIATDKPLVGPKATAAALAARVTLVAPTRGPEPDDYPTMIEYAWQLIYENYYSDQFNGVDWDQVLVEYKQKAEAIETQQEFWALMDEFVGQLGDDHSNFRTPAEVAAQYGGGSFSGRPFSGINMWPPPGHPPEFLHLWDVCDLGPAAQADLETGDLVLAINGDPVELTEETDLTALVQRVMFGDGDSGQLTLTVQQGPDEAPRDVTLNLGGASGCSGWQSGILQENPRIGYIKAADFDQGSDTLLLDLINSLEQDAPLAGLILDIRHNPGGNSDDDISIFTTGDFGTVGRLREGRTRTSFRIRGPVHWNETTPMVLLTDESSHSAADYFAVAMKLSGRATLVGMPTAGNTDGWTSWTLPDGSLVGIAVMILQLPDGSSIEGVGVQPDVRVPLGEWGLKQQPDAQLEAGLETLLQQIN